MTQAPGSELPFQGPPAGPPSWLSLPLACELGSRLAASVEVAAGDPRLALAWVALALRRYAERDEVCLALGGRGPARRLVLRVELGARFSELLAAVELALAAAPVPVVGDEPWLRFDDERPAAALVVTWTDAGPRELHVDRLRVQELRGRSFAAGFARLAEGLVADRERALGRLPLLSPAEREELLEGLAGPSVPLPPARTVLDMFAAQVAASPEAPALVEDGRSLSYAALARRVECFAAGLQARASIARGDVVMVMAASSAELVAAMLAIMRVGAVYLPVDPDYPDARLREILGAARARLILGDRRRADLPADAPALSFAELAAAGQGAASMLREDQPGPALADPAYVIFTSGSTGRPKGIVQTHRCLGNFLAWQIADAGLGRGRRVLQHAALSFDVSVQEILYTLLSGGCLFLSDAGLRRDPEALLRFIVAHAIEVVDFPFSLINLLLALSPGLEQAPALTDIISAGEPLRMVPALRELLERRPRLRLHNHYGPAETHMLTCHTMSAAAGTLDPRPPLGRVIWNMRAYVLDEALELLPRGVVGEICISGPGLARGYTDPALERDKFVAHPFRAGERLYRSGDLGRWRDDGTLEILGRVDDLVKVRGYRIELGEIERRLLEHPAVAEAAVIVESNEDGSSLHAIVSGDDSSVLALRQHLERSLPAYMIPQRWSVRDRLPRSPNGKIARRELPGPSARALPIGGAAAAPAGTVEVALAELWQELLGVAPIARDDDLFDLGCDSLTATRALTAMRGRFAVALALRELYLAPTLAGLAARIEAGLAAQSEAGLAAQSEAGLAGAPQIDRSPEGEAAEDHPLSAAQRDMWLASAAAGTYDFAAIFELARPVASAAIERALAALAARHEALRSTYALVDGEPRQRVHERLPLTTTQVDLDGAAPVDDAALLQAGRAWARADAARPFALEREAPLRAHLLRAGGRALLVLSVHHIAVDAWSLGLIQTELAALIQAEVEGGAASLAAVAVQPRDFARWQRRWLASAEAAALAREARARIGEARSPQLPGARPPPRRRSQAGAALEFELDAAPVRALARAEGASPYMVCLAGFALTLARLTGADDLLIGATGSGRLAPGLEQSVGLYAELLAVRVQLAGAASFVAALARAREGVLAAHDQQMLPHAAVVAALARPGGEPLFDVGFQLLPAPRGEGAGGLLRWRETVWAEGARAQLWFAGVEHEHRLRFRVEYSTARLDRATVEGFVARYQDTLAALLASPRAALESPTPATTERRGPGWFELSL